MYNVTLIHLAPGAITAALDWDRIERHNVPAEEMRSLLENFAAIDPIENADADPEMRVQIRAESYLIRTGQKKLILYDSLHREIPGQTLTVEEVMAELDGTAMARRTAAPFLFAESEAVGDTFETVAPPPRARASKPRVLALTAILAALLAAHGGWSIAQTAEDGPGFEPLAASELEVTREKMTGVYLTGSQPGDHGIALSGSGELKLFEMRGVEAPGVVHANGVWGRVGSGLCLATDQPGGLITVPDADTLVYCGETYKRVR